MAKPWLEKTKSFLTAGPPPRFVALDMEGRKLRVVYADPGRGMPTFRTLALVEAPAEVDLKNAQALGRFIGGALKQLNLSSTRVLMDVPRSQSVLKTLTLPPVEHERELPAMVRYQVEKELPFPLDQAVIDFTVDEHYVADAGDESSVVATRPQTIDVLVAAVQRSVVEHAQKVAEAGGFRLHRLGLRPYADMRCLNACLAPAERRMSILLVHVLPGEVEINLLIEGALAFSRSGLIRQHDDDGRPYSEKEILEGFVVEIARSAQSALSAHRGRKIERVYLAGDTGQEQTIVEMLAQRFRMPCAVLEPTEALKLNAGELAGPGFISPIGLAIAHGTAERMPFDFLNPKNPPIERNIKKIRAVTLATAASLLLLIGFTWGMISRTSAASQLASLRTQYNDLKKNNDPIEKLGQRSKAIEEWQSESLNWLDHWANISAKLPPAVEAYITTLKTNPDGSFAFTVRARASKVITDLSKSLREAGYDVKLGAETVQNDDYGYRYTTSVRLTVDGDAKIEPAKLKAPPRPSDDGSAELIRRGRTAVTSAISPSSPPPVRRSVPQDDEDEDEDETESTAPAAATNPAPAVSATNPATPGRPVATPPTPTTATPSTGGGPTTSRPSTPSGSRFPARPSTEKSSDNREKTDDKGKTGGYRSRDDRSRDR